nr:PilC/PilY family type IV pilus protein [Malonomonas rubra]
MRRGGGIDTLDAATSRGSYYALDVTNPLSPQFLWEIDSTTTGFSELGETWSDAVIGKIRLNGSDKIVAFIGAGYDNNEDLRFGNTQLFPDNTTTATSTILPTADANDVTSSGSSAQVNPKGRGIYVIELATVSYPTISPFLPTVAVNTSPQKLWEYVYDADREDSNLDAYDPGNNPKYSFVATIATLDSDFDGYIDRLYSGDTGGNMWRFDIGDKTSTSAWDATKIFSANPSDVANSDEDPATNGRKIFYRPSIVQEPGYVGVYFGTGDRAHPLNKAVIDRLYAVYDRGNITSARTEEHLVNVTEDNLQSASPGIGVVNSTLLALSSTSNYGWFIKLDLLDGEKVLSNPIVFNKVAYYTTFTANVPSDDPCEQGQLGIGRLYAVDYKTGEAVFNFDLTNDVADEDSYAENENERAIAGGGKILRRSDRVKTIGSGIPSGAVVVVREDGTSSALIGCGGGLCGGETKGGGTAVPIYWMME